jgi:hypothetical protein
LAPTAPLIHRPDTDRAPVLKRRVAHVVVLLLAATLLASCAGSRASDSRKAQERDATKGAVLPGLQATKTVKDFFPSTPTPMPTMTPMATIASLQLATQVSSTGEALNTITHASPGQSVYAVAELSHLRAGETVSARWFNSTGDLLGQVDQPVASDMDSAWVALAYTIPGGAYGNCWVEIWVNYDTTKMNSIVFGVG